MIAAIRASSSPGLVVTRLPLSCSYLATIAPAPTYASRQPSAPQRQVRPPTTIVVGPPSPAPLVAPRETPPLLMLHVPTPIPRSTSAAVAAADVAIPGVDLKQPARSASVGVLEADLDDDPLRLQGGDQVAPRGRAQAGQIPDLVPSERTVEEDLPQRAGPVALAEIPYRGGSGPGHRPACLTEGPHDAAWNALYFRAWKKSWLAALTSTKPGERSQPCNETETEAVATLTDLLARQSIIYVL